MTRARSALLSLCGLTAVLLLTSPQLGKAEASALLHGTVAVFIVDRVSFEEMMSDPRFAQIAASGGAALMAAPPDDRSQENAYRVLGSGVGSGGVADQLLAQVLARNSVGTCMLEPSNGFALGPPAAKSPLRFLGIGSEEEAACRAGSQGADEVLFVSTGFTDRADQPDASPAERSAARKQALETDGRFIEGLIGEQSLPGRSLVIVVTPLPSIDMRARGDEVTPLLIAEGTNMAIFGGGGSPRALRSDTTRQDGLVANVDVAPTILGFYGIPIPKEMTGSPIRVGGTTAVAHLHQLHLDQRRIRLPLQLGEVAFISLLFILAVATLASLRLGRRLPAWMAAAMRFLIVCAVALMIPLMAGGLLPRLTYAVVVPFIVLSTIALAMVALAARWPGPMGPFAFLGAVGLGFMAVDGLFGWRGLRIPLLGATMFDGARFYGIPNAFLATLLGSSLFVATVLEPWVGTALLFGAGLFAGFPALGADLGGSATLFVAAGLWWWVRTPGKRLGTRVLVVPGVVIGGLALVVLANRYLPGAPTHIAGFVERSGNGLSGVWHAFTRRLDVGVGQLRDVPAGWIPMLLLPVVLVTAMIRPEPIRSGLAVAGNAWRDALIVLTLAAMASFFANDTGVAAAAPAFLYAATSMAYPMFLRARPG